MVLQCPLVNIIINRNGEKVAEYVDKAFYIASTGRSDPVVIDLLNSVLK